MSPMQEKRGLHGQLTRVEQSAHPHCSALVRGVAASLGEHIHRQRQAVHECYSTRAPIDGGSRGAIRFHFQIAEAIPPKFDNPQ